jgi:hypothetical protein
MAHAISEKRHPYAHVKGTKPHQATEHVNLFTAKF